jgi:hypothetical protein
MMALMRQPVLPSDGSGFTTADLLAPTTYVATVENHPDVAPVTVPVSEGGVVETTLTVP